MDRLARALRRALLSELAIAAVISDVTDEARDELLRTRPLKFGIDAESGQVAEVWRSEKPSWAEIRASLETLR